MDFRESHVDMHIGCAEYRGGIHLTQFVMVSEKIMFLVNFDTFFSFLWGVPAEGLEWVLFYILVRNLARNRTRNNYTFFINFHIFYSGFFIYFYSIYSNWFVSKKITMLCIYITCLLIFLVKWGVRNGPHACVD